jgi:two-component system KDP operon response regulator KdpE
MAPPLRGPGADVATATTGHAALDAVDRQPPPSRHPRSGAAGSRRDRGLPAHPGGGAIPILVRPARGAGRDGSPRSTPGADDYVTKPFGAENCSRESGRAALRRADDPASRSPHVIRDLAIDVDRRRVTRGVEELRRRRRVRAWVSRAAPRTRAHHRAQSQAIWGPNAVDQPEHLRVLVNALRRKLEPTPGRPKYILTEPWVGYRFADL